MSVAVLIVAAVVTAAAVPRGAAAVFAGLAAGTALLGVWCAGHVLDVTGAAAGIAGVAGRVLRPWSAALLGVTLAALGPRRVGAEWRLSWVLAAAGSLLAAAGAVWAPDSVDPRFEFGAPTSPLGVFEWRAATEAVRLVGAGLIAAAAVSAAVSVSTYHRKAAPAASAAVVGVVVVLVAAMSDAENVAATAAGLFAGGAGLARCARLDVPISSPSGRGRWLVGSFDEVAAPWLAGARAAAVLWAAATVASDPGWLVSRWPAALGVVAAGAVTLTAATWAWTRRLPPPPFYIVDVAVAICFLALDALATEPGHRGMGEPTLGGPWIGIAVAAAGVGAGPLWGAAAAVVISAASGLATAENAAVFGSPEVELLLGSSVSLVALGAGAGALAARLRDAEVRIASANARAAVARRLHDGVLQTLALVARRSREPDLAALARDSDRELRDFLREGDTASDASVMVAVRDAARAAEKRFGLRVDVLVSDEVDASRDVVAAAAGAVGEALANVAKHASVNAATVSVGVDVDGRGLVSIVDAGIGYGGRGGRGVTESIVARMSDVGGAADVRALAGGGTEVRLWLS